MVGRLFEPRATPILATVPQASSDIVPVAAAAAAAPVAVPAPAAASAPIDLTTFPKLLAAGTSDNFEGHHSHELLAALAQNAAHNGELEAELARLGSGASFHGHASGDIASALAEYVQSHPGQSMGAAMLAAGMPVAGSAPVALAATAGVTELTLTAAFSWAAQLQGLQWARIIYGITWIVGGLILLFFGYSSLFWLARTGERKAPGGVLSAAAAALPGLSGGQKASGARKAPLGGGIGGVLIGFFSFSYLAGIIHAAICASEPQRAVGSGAFFAIWLVPGLVGAGLCGHFKLAAKTMSGLMGGLCVTLILTAIFGIHTILIRSILLAIFATLATAPLLLPRSVLLQRLILNANTSLLGVVAFLDGVALFAPPKASSAGWIDLWVLLFAKDDSIAATQAVQAWGTSAFKGYIAGAVLGATIGFAFEAFLHRHAGEDAEASWNEYLGAYADRYEKSGMLPGQYEGSLARQGLFEPAPSAWQKLANFFDSGSSTRPASYGNVPGGQRARGEASEAGSTLTEMPRLGMSAGKAKRARSSRSRSSRGPARFEALGRTDLEAAEDSDDTEVGSDDEDKAKARLLSSGAAYKGVELHDEDVLSPLARSTYALPGQLPRPPGLEAQSRSASYTSEVMQTTSNLSGSTKVSSTPSDGEAHKPYTSYRDGAPTSPSASAPSGAPVPATPSLIRAITRIESAQAQARAWQAQQAAGGPAAPYGATPASPPPQQAGAATQGGAKFDEWWKSEVRGGK